jgi:hypothetical protein
MVGCVTHPGLHPGAMGLDALMGREGFGPVGNAFVLTGGFFLSIFLQHPRLQSRRHEMGAGRHPGAFVVTGRMAVARACSIAGERTSPLQAHHAGNVGRLRIPASRNAAIAVSRRLLDSLRPSSPRTRS